MALGGLAFVPVYADDTIIFHPAGRQGICFQIDRANQRYQIGTAALEVMPESGRVDMRHDRIIFFPDGGSSYACTYRQPANSFYTKGIRCKINDRFYDYVEAGSMSQPGTLHSVGGQQIVFLGELSGKVKEPVRIRAKPGLKGLPIKFREFRPGSESYMCSSGNYVEKGAIPQDWKITVLGRTPEKMQIGNAEEYWYYIQLVDGCNREITGWSYGEFIELTENPPIQRCTFY